MELTFSLNTNTAWEMALVECVLTLCVCNDMLMMPQGGRLQRGTVRDCAEILI